ncbi:solute carrier family 22 member 6-A [Columba guinea]|nr:solute carrier family 22 member 6-A [Columba guinea]
MMSAGVPVMAFGSILSPCPHVPSPCPTLSRCPHGVPVSPGVPAMAFGSILSPCPHGVPRCPRDGIQLHPVPMSHTVPVSPCPHDVPSVTPRVPSATPGVPSVPSVTPGILSAIPIVPSATPSIPSATPSVPSATPSVPSIIPSVPSATLGVPDPTPSIPSATPGVSNATFGVPSAIPGVPSVTPIVPSITPEPPGPISGGTLGAPGGISAASGGTLGTPGDTSGSPDGTLVSPNATLGSCHLYVSPSNGSGGPVATEPCPHGWDYDRSVYVATIVTEWDLVCGYRQLRQMAQSIYMAGVLVGALVLGGLSDRFGRKALLLWSYLQLGVMGTCTAFAPNYASYCAFRFAGGMALSGFGLSIACLVVEWIPTPYRAVTVAITGFSYTLGQILLAGIAYAVPHWRWLQLTVSLPFFGFFCCSWWLAESARWLVLSGKAEKAVKVLQRVAKINRKKEEGEKITVEILRSSMKEELAALKSSYTVSDLVRTPVIRHIFFCLSIVWFSISFSYYGLAMDLQNFGVSIYLIQVIFGAVDVPAKLVVTVSVSYVGRRVSLMVALFLAGLVIIANIFVSTELQTLRTALAVIGKGCLSASFNCVFLYTTELYPTPIRQTGLGFGSTMARVGGIVAPLVKMTEEYYPFLPPAVYGVAPVVATVAAGFLPETLNMPLPDTIEEVESRARRKPPEEPKEKIPLQPQDP